MIRAAALAVLIAGPALAHGDAAWIQSNPAYVASTGAHCCGPSDCWAAKPDELEAIPGGWRHVPTGTTLFTGERGVYPSEQPRPFVCVRGGRMVCAFPGGGF